MEPITASFAFSSIVQLLCNFRQERGAAKSKDLTDFLTWLAYHKFDEVKSRIEASSLVQEELQTLLREEVGALNTKLDIIHQAVVGIGSQFKEFSQLAVAVGAEKDSLSQQAKSILLSFATSESTRMGVFLEMPTPTLALFPENKALVVPEPKFLADDIELLCRLDLMKLVDHNQSGNPIYALTRIGGNFLTSMD